MQHSNRLADSCSHLILNNGIIHSQLTKQQGCMLPLTTPMDLSLSKHDFENNLCFYSKIEEIGHKDAVSYNYEKKGCLAHKKTVQNMLCADVGAVIMVDIKTTKIETKMSLRHRAPDCRASCLINIWIRIIIAIPLSTKMHCRASHFTNT
jgi:hypothetical protein